MDPPATPGRGFFFEDAEMSQRAVTSPEPFQHMKEMHAITPSQLMGIPKMATENLVNSIFGLPKKLPWERREVEDGALGMRYRMKGNISLNQPLIIENLHSQCSCRQVSFSKTSFIVLLSPAIPTVGPICTTWIWLNPDRMITKQHWWSSHVEMPLMEVPVEDSNVALQTPGHSELTTTGSCWDDPDGFFRLYRMLNLHMFALNCASWVSVDVTSINVRMFCAHSRHLLPKLLWAIARVCILRIPGLSWLLSSNLDLEGRIVPDVRFVLSHLEVS